MIHPSNQIAVDVTLTPHFAKGDGKVDDTTALPEAINENVGANVGHCWPCKANVGTMRPQHHDRGKLMSGT